MSSWRRPLSGCVHAAGGARRCHGRPERPAPVGIELPWAPVDRQRVGQLVRPVSRGGRLVIVPGVDFGVRSTLCIAYLRRRTLSKPAQRFVELLLEHDAELIVVGRELLSDLEKRKRSRRSGNRR